MYRDHVTAAVAIHPNGDTQDIDLAGSDAQQLTQLQQLVGGYIEAMTSHPKVTVFWCEDGIRDRMPVNSVAGRGQDRCPHQ